MKNIIRKKTDHAVVGMVSAILIIGLIVAVISIIQTIYVPKIMEQREAEHMDEVAKQFTFLTSVIDDQAADARKDIPIPTFLTLGSKELPFLVSSKAFGTLEILENSCLITINDTSVFPIGTIRYASDNAYYLDQNYTYEAGSMIVSQSQGDMMMIPPSFFVEYNQTTNIVTITFDVVNISSVGDKMIASGFGTYPIQTEFYNISASMNFTDVHRITIDTVFLNSWFIFINHSLMEEDLNYAGYGSQFYLNNTGDVLELEFPSNGLSPTVNIVFKLIEIHAQVGPGWIK